MNSFSKILILLLLANQVVFAQNKTENVFIIMTDGFRWQELYGGADSTLIFSKEFTPDSAQTVKEFWAKTPAERREKLLPFFGILLQHKGNFMAIAGQEIK